MNDEPPIPSTLPNNATTDSEETAIPPIPVDDTPIIAPVPVLASTFDLADLHPATGHCSWLENQMDQTPLSNVQWPILPGPSDWESALLQDWSHQSEAAAE